jgi:integrase/recombinase XerC
MSPHLHTFITYLKYEKRYSPHTVTAYGDDLTSCFEYIQKQFEVESPEEMPSAFFRSWLASMKEEGIGSRTILRKISSLKSFYKYLLKNGIVKKNPVVNIVVPKINKRLPVYVEEQQVADLFSYVEFSEGWKGTTERLAMALLYQAGLRLSELIDCREDQVDFSYKTLRIRGKGSKERIVPLSDGILSDIRQYMDAKRRELETFAPDVLLVTDNGKKLYPKYVYRLVKTNLQKVTTIDKKSPHVLRHSFATHLSNNGAELNSVKELLGHSSLAATQVYTHNTIEKLKNVHKKAHPKG